MARDWSTAPLRDVDRELCRFAVRLTHHQQAVNEDDLAPLRTHGLDDRALHDTVQVVSLFNYYNRIAHGLGVELEPDDLVRPWGEQGMVDDGPPPDLGGPASSGRVSAG